MFNGILPSPFQSGTSSNGHNGSVNSETAPRMSGALPATNGRHGLENGATIPVSDRRGRPRSQSQSPSSTENTSSLTLFSEFEPSRVNGNGTGPYSSLASSTMVEQSTRNNSPDPSAPSNTESDALTVRPSHSAQNRRGSRTPAQRQEAQRHVHHVIRREALRRPSEGTLAAELPPTEPSNRVFTLDQWTDIANVLIEAKGKEADPDEQFNMLMARLDKMREKALEKQLAGSVDRKVKEERTREMEKLALAAMRRGSIGNWLSELLNGDD